ncbi:Matrilin 2 [Cichlidogyrus casuarinus]|uniref:Matrilin 2 n=1 Tax=Cichlidogyrus casuarinus TaxID=1844966 RepID=A0ABD2Q8L8_9PLAT
MSMLVMFPSLSTTENHSPRVHQRVSTVGSCRVLRRRLQMYEDCRQKLEKGSMCLSQAENRQDRLRWPVSSECPEVKKEVSPCKDMIKRTKFTYFKLVPGGPEGFQCTPQYTWHSDRCDCPTREITHGTCKNNFRVRKMTSYNLVHGHCVSSIETTEIQCACPKPKIHTSACDGTHVAVKLQVENLNAEDHCDKNVFVGFKPCKQSCKNAMDVGFLITTANSLDYSSFPAVRSFIAAMTQSLPISRTGTHVALGRYSSTKSMNLLFHFQTFFKAPQAVDRINEMRFHPGSTSSGEALQMMRLSAYSATHGSRKDVSRVLYIITSVESNGNKSTIAEAEKLKAMGVQLVVIGVGEHVDPSYLQQLASKPHSINVFLVRDYESLMGIKDQALESRCNAPGTVNHISVMKDIAAKLREINAIGSRDYTPLGLTQLDFNQMALLGFSVPSYFSVVAGTQEWQHEKFREEIVAALAKAVGCEIFEIVDFQCKAVDAEAKSIRFHFKMERKYGPKVVELLKKKSVKFMSVNKKVLPEPTNVTYISPC